MAELFVHESGTPGSPAVVFLHGAGVSGLMWRDHMARLTGLHCLAPDLPGHGESNRQPWISLDATARDVADLIEARVPARRAHVVGLSVGGAVAHTLLATRPALLERVIIDGAGTLPWPGRVPFLAGIALMTPFLHSRPVIGMLSRSVGRIPDADRAEIKRASRRAFFHSYRDALSLRLTPAEIRATCPTLFVAGEREKPVRQSNAALAELMPNAAARFVPGLGHGWLGTDLDLHIAMVEAWLAARHLPGGLAAETMAGPRDTVARLLEP
jgi:pimeloyl-ACP methyl ester carboxylesterase